MSAINEIVQDISENNTEDELIDIDEELSYSKDSEWLIKFDESSPEIKDEPFCQMKFSTPVIDNLVKSIYQSGLSKRMLHDLLHCNDKMSVSYDNYKMFRYSSHISWYNSPEFKIPTNYRHSIAIGTLESSNDVIQNESPTDSLNSSRTHIQEMMEDDSKDVLQLTDAERMTHSSIVDYNFQMFTPQESDSGPFPKAVAKQNVLSRTYDKEDLEILKQTQLSQSVFVPHISGSNTEDYSQIDFKNEDQMKFNAEPPMMSRSFTNHSSRLPQKKPLRSLKRLFPATKAETSVPLNRAPDKIGKLRGPVVSGRNSDAVNQIGQKKPIKFSAKPLLKYNKDLVESDLITPINSPRIAKRLNGHTKL